MMKNIMIFCVGLAVLSLAVVQQAEAFKLIPIRQAPPPKPAPAPARAPPPAFDPSALLQGLQSAVSGKLQQVQGLVGGLVQQKQSLLGSLVQQKQTLFGNIITQKRGAAQTALNSLQSMSSNSMPVANNKGNGNGIIGKA